MPGPMQLDIIYLIGRKQSDCPGWIMSRERLSVGVSAYEGKAISAHILAKKRFDDHAPISVSYLIFGVL